MPMPMLEDESRAGGDGLREAPNGDGDGEWGLGLEVELPGWDVDVESICSSW